MGTPSSGIYGHIRGWDVGCAVHVTDRDGVDVVTVYRTGGSNEHHSRELIAEFTASDLS